MKMSEDYAYFKYYDKFIDEANRKRDTALSTFAYALKLACKELFIRDCRIRELEVKVSEMNEYQKGNWFLLCHVK